MNKSSKTGTILAMKISVKTQDISSKVTEILNKNPFALHPAKKRSDVNPSNWDNTWDNSFSKKGV
jgi:hypothetical protein